MIRGYETEMFLGTCRMQAVVLKGYNGVHLVCGFTTVMKIQLSLKRINFFVIRTLPWVFYSRKLCAITIRIIDRSRRRFVPSERAVLSRWKSPTSPTNQHEHFAADLFANRCRESRDGLEWCICRQPPLRHG